MSQVLKDRYHQAAELCYMTRIVRISWIEMLSNEEVMDTKGLYSKPSEKHNYNFLGI